MTPKLMKQLKLRDKYCWHCGEDFELVAHHRKNRGMGGRPSLDRIDNLLLVCQAYNFAMEADAAQAAWAVDYGHKLRQWEDFSLPVFDQVAHKWFVLNPYGGKTETETPQDLLF
jgi:hypothetical protein